MVELLEKQAIKGSVNLEDAKLYEIDLGEKGYLTASDIVNMDPECQSDGCCYSGGGCYSNCDM